MEAKSVLNDRESNELSEGFVGYPPSSSKVLWCGMHKAFISREDKSNGELTLAQDQSMSRDRSVAEFFLANQGKSAREGTLFRVNYYFDSDYHDISGAVADLSWISKFPDEQEVLVEAGLVLRLENITTISTS